MIIKNKTVILSSDHQWIDPDDRHYKLMKLLKYYLFIYIVVILIK